MDHLFTSQIGLVGFMLLITGLLLLFSDRKKETTKSLRLPGFSVGWPGSGHCHFTRNIQIRCHISPQASYWVSIVRMPSSSPFLMVIPLILGKIAKDVLDGSFWSSTFDPITLILGFLAAFISGYFACRWMIALVKNARLKYFAYYCFAVGFISILVWI